MNIQSTSKRSRRLLLCGASLLTLLAAQPAFGQTVSGLRGGAASTGAAETSGRPASTPTTTVPPVAESALQRQVAMRARVATAEDLASQAQAAARATASLRPSVIPNGLTAGGLVVDPRVAAGAGANLWINAEQPTQTASGGETIVTIKQTAQHAVLTWEQFNVGRETTVNFDQSGGNSANGNSWVALNRIDATGAPSQILGRIKAEGQVLLLNPNGIIFGGTSQVNVHSLIASALDFDFSGGTVFAPPRQNDSGGFEGGYVYAPVTVRNESGAEVPVTLADGTAVFAPDAAQTAISNTNFIVNGFWIPTSTTDSGANTTRFSLGDQSLGQPGGGAITVEVGAQLSTSVSGVLDGGYIALLGASVANAGEIHTRNGQIILAAGNSISLTQPYSTDSGLPIVDLAHLGQGNNGVFITVSAIGGQAGSQGAPFSAPFLNGTGIITNATGGILQSNDGAITLAGDSVLQSGIAYATTSITRPAAIIIDTSGASIPDRSVIDFGDGSVTAILPDENGETIPISQVQLLAYLQQNGSPYTQSTYFTKNLQPRITLTTPGGASGVAFRDGALVRAPGAALTALLGPTSALLMESGSVIDLSGLAGVEVPVTNNLVSVLITQNEVADTPLAQNLIGKTVTIDVRRSGTRADGLSWVGSPLLNAAGYAGTVPVTISEILTAGGSFSVPQTSITGNDGSLITTTALQVVQAPGASLNISGGYVHYVGGDVATTRLVGSDGRIYDIGAADPNISYLGFAGTYNEISPRWGVSNAFVNPLVAGASDFEPDYVAGASAGSVNVAAGTPVIAGDIFADLIVGQRQRAFARGGGSTPQTSLEMLPTGAVLNLNVQAAYSLLLETSEQAGPDPFTLSSFELGITSWPTLPGNILPILTDKLSADGFATISITGNYALANMATGASLAVSPGGSISLVQVGSIDGTLSAAAGKITLTGYDASRNLIPVGDATQPTDLVIGPHAILDVRGLWVNDFGAGRDTLQGSAFIDGGSISITTPRTVYYHGIDIASGSTVAANGLVSDYGLDWWAGQVTGQFFYTTDATASIVLAPGSIVDVSSGGYVGTKGLKYGSDGLPLGRGGNLTLQTYTDRPVPTFTPIFQTVTGGAPLTLADGTTLAAGTDVYVLPNREEYGYTRIDNPSTGYGIFAPGPGVTNDRANVVMAGDIYASGFSGGGTLSLQAPRIVVGDALADTNAAKIVSYLRSDAVAALVSPVTGTPFAAIDSSALTPAIDSGTGPAAPGTLAFSADFFEHGAFGKYVLSSTYGGTVVTADTRIVLSQANYLQSGALTQPLDGLSTIGAGPSGGSVDAVRVNEIYQPTGARVRDFAPVGEVLPIQRKPASLQLVQTGLLGGYKGDPNSASGLLFDAGASIIADPSATISFISGSWAAVLGSITAPGGTINLIASPPGTNALLYGGSTAASALWIGPDAMLDVSGIFVADARLPYRSGKLLDGGTISLVSRSTFVQPGAVFLLNGAATTLEAPVRGKLPDIVETYDVWSDGGALQLGGTNLYFAGSVSAAGGAPLATGGRLVLGDFAATGDLAALFPVSGRGGATLGVPGASQVAILPSGDIIANFLEEKLVTADTGTTAYPTTQAQAAALSGPGGFFISSGTPAGQDGPSGLINNSGFDSVTINTPVANPNNGQSGDGYVAFIGSQAIRLPGALTIWAREIAMTGEAMDGTLLPEGVGSVSNTRVTCTPVASCVPTIGGTDVGVDAGYVRLIGAQSAVSPPNLADGTLNIRADWIDLQGYIQLNNVLDATLTASEAVRAVPNNFGLIGRYDSQNGYYGGALLAPGNLTIAAPIVYPATSTHFMFQSTGTIDGVNNSLAIAQNGAAPARMPLSAGGALILSAQNITQGGTLAAPLGSILLGINNFTNLPVGNQEWVRTASLDVTLAPGSLTSVSADGLDIPFGYTVDGLNWYISSPTAVAAGTPIGTLLGSLPGKQITISSAAVSTKAGAAINADGGGDIYAVEYVAGPGGTRNLLTNFEQDLNFIRSLYSVDIYFNSQFADGRQIYALVPSELAKVAAYDPTFATYPFFSGSAAPGGSDGSRFQAPNTYSSFSGVPLGQAIAPGTSVVLSGGDGIAAGNYTLLPGMYATLPGAYRVVQVGSNLNPGLAESNVTEDGSILQTGYFANAITGARSSDLTLFKLQPNAVWTKGSQINITSGTAFFADRAINAGTVVPTQPADAGILTLNATGSLVLNGTNSFAPAKGGRSGQVQISATKILVLASDQIEAESNSEAGYLVLDADQLSKLGVGSLLLGGSATISTTTNSLALNAVATSLEIQTSEAHPLLAPELLLVTRAEAGSNGLTVDAGSVVKAVGTVAPGSSLDITTSAAPSGSLLRLSNGDMVAVQRNGGNAQGASILIGAAPGTAALAIDAAPVILSAATLTLDSSGANILAPNTILSAKSYDLSANTIGFGAAPADAPGLNLTAGQVGSLAGADSVRFRSASVFNFYDLDGLALGSSASLIKSLTFDGSGFYSQGGSTTIYAGNIRLLDSQVAIDQSNAITGTGEGSLVINAADTLTLDYGYKTLNGYGNVASGGGVALNAGRQVVVAGGCVVSGTTCISPMLNGAVATPGLDAGSADLSVTTPALVVASNSAILPIGRTSPILSRTEQTIATTGKVALLSGEGVAPSATGTSGERLGIRANSIDIDTAIQVRGGTLDLTAVGGDLTLGDDASIDARGSSIALLDRTEFAAGGVVNLRADTGDVVLAGGSEIDVSGDGLGYAGTVAIQTGPTGTASIKGELRGDAAFKSEGGSFQLSASTLDPASVLPYGSFSRSFVAQVENGDFEIALGTTLAATQVGLSTANGNIVVNGTIDASSPGGGVIELFAGGKASGGSRTGGITIGASGVLRAAYQASAAGDPTASPEEAQSQDGGTITLGVSGTPNGTFDPVHGYQNVDASGSASIVVERGAVLDVSGGPVGKGGQITVRAPLLTNGNVNVSFDGTGVQGARAVALNAYAVWSTTDATTGGQHFDGVIDPAGWFDSSGRMVDGTWTDVVSGVTSIAVPVGKGGSFPYEWWLPSVSFDIAPGEAGTGATGTAILSDTNGVTLIRAPSGANAGVGYQVPPTVVITGDGMGAKATVIAGAQIELIDGGAGFTSMPEVTISGGGGPTTSVLPQLIVTKIIVTDGGSGYTSPPQVDIGYAGRATAQIENGKVVSVTITSTSLVGGQFPEVIFRGGGAKDTEQAHGYAVARIADLAGSTGSGKIGNVRLEYGATTGFTSVPTVTITGGGGTGAQARVPGLYVAGVTVDDPGSGYTTAAISFAGGNPTTAAKAATPTLAKYVTSIEITNPGYGYTAPPLVSFGGGTLGIATIGNIPVTLATQAGGVRIDETTPIALIDPATGSFTPFTVNADHVGFYGAIAGDGTVTGTLTGFTRTPFDEGAVAGNFTGVQSGILALRPEIVLQNPDIASNSGNIQVLSNWNLGAGFIDSSGGTHLAYRTQSGNQPGVLTLRAANNIQVGPAVTVTDASPKDAITATISDGFFQRVDPFTHASTGLLAANRIGNNSDPANFTPNTTSAADLMTTAMSAGSFSYRFVAGASFGVNGLTAVNPGLVVNASSTPSAATGNFTLNGHIVYISNITGATGDSYNSVRPVDIPSLIRTGTGTIDIFAANNIQFLNTVSSGSIYTAGVALDNLPDGYTPPPMNAYYLDHANGLVGAPTWGVDGGAVSARAGQALVGIETPTFQPFGAIWSDWYYHSGRSNGTLAPFAGSSPIVGSTSETQPNQATAAWINYNTFFQGFGALGGGNVDLRAGGDISDVSASLPELLIVSGGLSAGDHPRAAWYGGGNLNVIAGGNLNSSAFLVGKGTGNIQVSGAVQPNPGNPVTGWATPAALILGVQDGYITLSANGSINLGGVFDPAGQGVTTWGQASGDNYSSVSTTRPGVLPNGQVRDQFYADTTPVGGNYVSYGPASGVSITSAGGDLSLMSGGVASLLGNLADYSGVSAGSSDAPASFRATALSGSLTIAGALTLTPGLTFTADGEVLRTSMGQLELVAARDLMLGWGVVSMADPSGATTNVVGKGATGASPFGFALGNLAAPLHADDSDPAVISAGRDIIGFQTYFANINLLKPVTIAAGSNIKDLSFIGQNNSDDEVTQVLAGNNITGGSYGIYGPGSFLIQAGHDLGPFVTSSSGGLTTNQTISGTVIAVGNGGNTVAANRFVNVVRPYLSAESADIYVLYGVKYGADFEATIDRFVDPVNAGADGIDFLPTIASIMGVPEGEAWAAFEAAPGSQQRVLVYRAYLDFLNQVATDYQNPNSAYFQQYRRAYEAISTLFPASLGYTDNSPGDGAIGSQSLVATGKFNMIKTVLETQQGSDINIIGPGGPILIGSASLDTLDPSQQGILTLAGGSIRAYTDGSILVNQSRILTAQGGNIQLFSANGDISAGAGPKTYTFNPPFQQLCNTDGYCHVNPTGLVSGAGIAAIVTLPGQDPSLSNVTLVAPRGTVDAGAAGIRVAGNLNIVAQYVANAFNIQVGGTAVGIPTNAPNVSANLAASNQAATAAAEVAETAQKARRNERPSIITVTIDGFGLGAGDCPPGSSEPCPAR